MAYLMQKHRLSPPDALARIQQARPICGPNSGFIAQLDLYHRMGCPTDLDAHPEYQRWLYQCELARSRTAGVAPSNLYFEDEQTPGDLAEAKKLQLRCRKCR
ncbi:MAG: tyrosine protein phosphatase yvh1 [Phylliscum demangeonii]|nr:MAG: tyrosine protein phosphatase yvh1 [Phylliscum demangeonii]